MLAVPMTKWTRTLKYASSHRSKSGEHFQSYSSSISPIQGQTAAYPNKVKSDLLSSLMHILHFLLEEKKGKRKHDAEKDRWHNNKWPFEWAWLFNYLTFRWCGGVSWFTSQAAQATQGQWFSASDSLNRWNFLHIGKDATRSEYTNCCLSFLLWRLIGLTS